MIGIIGLIINGVCVVAWFSSAILLQIFKEPLMVMYPAGPPEWLLLSLLFLGIVSIISFLMALLGR